jgi:hypothetical protein
MFPKLTPEMGRIRMPPTNACLPVRHSAVGVLRNLGQWTHTTCRFGQCPHAKGSVRLFVRPKLVHRHWDYQHLTTAFIFASADHSTTISSKRNTGQSNILASLAWRWNQEKTLYLKDVRIVLNSICLGLFLAVIRRGLGITRPRRLRHSHTHLYSKLAVSHLKHSGHVAANGTPGRVQLKYDGTRWRTGGEVKGKLVNGVGSSTLHTNSEHGVSSITAADAHTSAASSRLNWRPRRFKWARPFRRKTKSGFCACAITFQTQSTAIQVALVYAHWFINAACQFTSLHSSYPLIFGLTPFGWLRTRTLTVCYENGRLSTHCKLRESPYTCRLLYTAERSSEHVDCLPLLEYFFVLPTNASDAPNQGEKQNDT